MDFDLYVLIMYPLTVITVEIKLWLPDVTLPSSSAISVYRTPILLGLYPDTWLRVCSGFIT